MQLAENSNEIAFETIQKELNIGENDVETFIIEGIVFVPFKTVCYVVKKLIKLVFFFKL